MTRNCCIPVENVSWMLLSEGGETRTSVRAQRWSFLALVITHHAEYMGGLLYTVSELQQGENSEDSNVLLASGKSSALLDVSWRSVFCSLVVMLKHPEITESFGGNYCSEFSGFWTLSLAWSCLSTVSSNRVYFATGTVQITLVIH